MPREARRRDRLVGLFALGLILFNVPGLWTFAGTTPVGSPLLFAYLFCAWAVVIAMIALIVERRGPRPPIGKE